MGEGWKNIKNYPPLNIFASRTGEEDPGDQNQDEYDYKGRAVVLQIGIDFITFI